jgi:DNA-binding MarR family transcriptional regulator
VSRAATAIIDDAVRASGVDADEFAIYSVLASTPGMTPTELAHWMAAPATTVSSYVRRFERRGHVRKIPNPNDRRSYRVQLTAAGRRVHQAAGELFRPTLQEVTSRLGPGVSDTHRRLQTLHQTLTSINDDQPPGQ